ncbi:hypothetical protein HDU98_006308, partial [Podochytrium sp. JEL0797]
MTSETPPTPEAHDTKAAEVDSDEAEEERLRQLREDKKRLDEEKAASDAPSAAPLAAGCLVWAKVKGYPWWPGRVEHEDALPSNIIGIKPRTSAVPHLPILFCGTRDYGWIAHDQLKLFNDPKVKDEYSKKNKQANFLLALREANDPDSIDAPVVTSKRAASKTSKRKDNADAEDGDSGYGNNGE